MKIILQDRLNTSGKVTFFFQSVGKEATYIKGTNFLHNRNFWNAESIGGSIWCITTDLGDSYYAEFEKTFWTSMERKGFLRNGKKYSFTYHSFDMLQKIQFRNVVRTLGIAPAMLDNHLAQYTDSLTHTKCIVDTRTNTIIDIVCANNFS